MGDLIEEGEGGDMTPRLVGEPYKRRTSGESSRLRLYALYECAYCKKEFEAQVSNIKNGGTKSCGCQRGKTTHGLTYNKFYKTWHNMIQRCTSPKIKAYKDYGGRGISVCEEWLDTRNFVDWCDLTHPNQEGYTLDRINNDLGYSPKNCRWVDKSTQAINRRMRRTNTSGFVGVGFKKSKGKWEASLKLNNIYKYIGSFLTIEEAVQARDNYIIENKLPHKLSTEY